MKNKIIKNVAKDMLFFFIIMVAISSIILIRPLNDLDELWNYNFARNILDGKVPYKDFNMVTTPGTPIIEAMCLKIFGNELIVMRGLAILLNTIILWMIFKIFNKLKINYYISFLLTLCIYYLLKNFVSIDYNFANLLIVLIIIYLELSELDKNESVLKYNSRVDFIIGILAGLSMCFKQTTGLFIAFVSIGYKILQINNIDDLKIFTKIALKRFLGVTIPITMLLIYLLFNNAVYEFIDYCIKGVRTFNNYILYNTLLKLDIVTKVLSIIIPINFIIMFLITIVKKNKFKWQKQLFVMFSYSLAAFVVAFPISDQIHFFIGSIPSIIAMIYMIYLIIVKIISKIKLDNRLKKILIIKKIVILEITILSILTVVQISIISLNNYFNNSKTYNQINHFKYVYISDSLTNRIKTLTNYIIHNEKNGKKVYVLDASAATYMIPLDKYNKDYDMFLRGNLGVKSEEGQIEKIDNEEDALYLILNDNYRRNWQTPEGVITYIKNNLTKVGEIEIFDIYE